MKKPRKTTYSYNILNKQNKESSFEIYISNEDILTESIETENAIEKISDLTDKCDSSSNTNDIKV